MNFNKKNKSEIENEIIKAYNKIKKEMFEKDEELNKYIEKNMKYIVNIIENSFKVKALDKIFIIEKFLL